MGDTGLEVKERLHAGQGLDSQKYKDHLLIINGKDLNDRCGTYILRNDVVSRRKYSGGKMPVIFDFIVFDDELISKIKKNPKYLHDNFDANDTKYMSSILLKDCDSLSNIDQEPFVLDFIKQITNKAGEQTGIFDKKGKEVLTGDTVTFVHHNFGDWNFKEKQLEKTCKSEIERTCVKTLSRDHGSKKLEIEIRFIDDSGRYWSMGHLKENDYIEVKG